MMRIITGKAKGIRLATLEGDNTRPTSERTKEAIFSMIQFEIEGRRVLDLFSGSGQMGLEALSRGAESAVMIDHAKAAVSLIKQNTVKTKLEGASIICADSLEFLRSEGRKRNEDAKYDIVFLDPPYDQKLIPKALELLLSGRLIKRSALIICESASNEDVFGGNASLEARFEVIKTLKHGIAYVNLLTPKRSEDNEDEL
ncbi:MAG: 16S rRNA (guanine(966)-N(2))-methyltransferase RsmD [Clostridia bacterium]|nr:16S rRNA (guanine(966)-N(2))-methyltransferase RsmD [Clostridia bacterium]